jgi:hypothetical protein
VRNLPDIVPIRSYGATVSAQLWIGHEHRQALRSAGLVEPDPVHINLLIDTGASSSWIRPDYLKQLGISKPRTWFDVVTVDGVEERQPAYEVCFILGGIATPSTKRFETFFGCKDFKDEPHDGLLGRRELGLLQFAWNGPSVSVRVSYD